MGYKELGVWRVMPIHAGTASPQALPHSPVVPETTIQQGHDGRVESHGPGRWLKLPGLVHFQGAPPWPVAQPETCEDQQAQSQGLLKPEHLCWDQQGLGSQICDPSYRRS